MAVRTKGDLISFKYTRFDDERIILVVGGLVSLLVPVGLSDSLLLSKGNPTAFRQFPVLDHLDYGCHRQHVCHVSAVARQWK